MPKSFLLTQHLSTIASLTQSLIVIVNVIAIVNVIVIVIAIAIVIVVERRTYFPSGASLANKENRLINSSTHLKNIQSVVYWHVTDVDIK